MARKSFTNWKKDKRDSFLLLAQSFLIAKAYLTNSWLSARTLSRLAAKTKWNSGEKVFQRREPEQANVAGMFGVLLMTRFYVERSIPGFVFPRVGLPILFLNFL